MALADESLFDVAVRMRARQVDSVILVEPDADGEWTPCGILNDRDIVAHALCPWERDLESLPAGRATTSKLEIAFEDEDLLEAITRMRRARLTCLPVVDDDGVLTGVLRLEDLFDYFDVLARALELLIIRDPRSDRVTMPS